MVPAHSPAMRRMSVIGAPVADVKEAQPVVTARVAARRSQLGHERRRVFRCGFISAPLPWSLPGGGDALGATLLALLAGDPGPVVEVRRISCQWSPWVEFLGAVFASGAEELLPLFRPAIS